MQLWLKELIRWLGEISEWIAGGRKGKAPRVPLVHRFSLSGPVNEWYHSRKRTVVEKRAFASLLLAIDSDPFLGEPMLEQAIPGQRSVGFAAGASGYGVIYEVNPGQSAIRMVSIVPP